MNIANEATESHNAGGAARTRARRLRRCRKTLHSPCEKKNETDETETEHGAKSGDDANVGSDAVHALKPQTLREIRRWFRRAKREIEKAKVQADKRCKEATKNPWRKIPRIIPSERPGIDAATREETP